MRHVTIVPEWAKKWILTNSQVVVDETTYIVHILSRNLEPRLPGFVGFPKGEFLFASEDVPEHFRPHIIAHEVREFTTLVGQKGRCLASLKQELAEVPAEILAGYTAYRRHFFDRLIRFYETADGMDEFKAEIAASHDFLVELTGS